MEVSENSKLQKECVCMCAFVYDAMTPFRQVLKAQRSYPIHCLWIIIIANIIKRLFIPGSVPGTLKVLAFDYCSQH